MHRKKRASKKCDYRLSGHTGARRRRDARAVATRETKQLSSERCVQNLTLNSVSSTDRTLILAVADCWSAARVSAETSPTNACVKCTAISHHLLPTPPPLPAGGVLGVGCREQRWPGAERDKPSVGRSLWLFFTEGDWKQAWGMKRNKEGKSCLMSEACWSGQQRTAGVLLTHYPLV